MRFLCPVSLENGCVAAYIYICLNACWLRTTILSELFHYFSSHFSSTLSSTKIDTSHFFGLLIFVQVNQFLCNSHVGMQSQSKSAKTGFNSEKSPLQSRICCFARSTIYSTSLWFFFASFCRRLCPCRRLSSSRNSSSIAPQLRNHSRPLIHSRLFLEPFSPKTARSLTVLFGKIPSHSNCWLFNSASTSRNRRPPCTASW